ncbi:Protein FdhE [Fundidesulfovibrio magnetotacticus]|uniref:Protein FdhE n=1 Tax=Fundidesulfovibrio magnetotacticus TaxID=2730080 RepID=A0A6V8LLV3_9BACT|nr:formate dehydrogenase accessory protein FdhE [Fundidesulfovibrio magnetotacticus]GFK92684.1 Protein FdhE [Fundidesulfovibrio magnetotacticus]
MQICSQTVFSSPQAIEADLARALEQVPAMAGLLESFGPLLVERARLREAAPGWTVPPPPIDPDRFSQGAFLLADSGFQDMSPQLVQAASSLLPVMARCFPSLTPALDALASGLESGAVAPGELVAAGFGEPRDIPGIDSRVLLFAGSELVRPFVERQAQDLLPLVKDLPWRHACCPVCGGAPNMSVMRRSFDPSEYIQAHGGRRYLRCSRCSVEWTYKRVSCPVCCCEEPEELAVLRDAARPYERVDACKRCKSFVLCLDAGELAAAPDPDVAALGMSALESRAVQEGFVPMARHPWSGLLG